MDSLYTDYFVYTRKQAVQKQSTIEEDIVKLWMFDYFTKHILNKEPISGLQFREVEGSQTRTAYIGEKCVDAYVDVGGYVAYKGRHCWQTIIYETVFDKDDNGEGIGGSEGSGGSGSSGSSGGSGKQEEEEEEKGTTNIGHSGGGSNSSNNGDDSKPDSTPCDRANRLQADTAFVAQVTKFFYEIDPMDNENGWIKSSTGSYLSPIERKATSLKYDLSQLGSGKIVEMYHTHPRGAPYLSWSDISALIYRYQNGQIDSSNFSYGVITDLGCLTLIITSQSEFDFFANHIKNYKDKYWDMVYDDTNKSLTYLLAKFVNFLNQEKSGISVLFNESDKNDYPGVLTTWESITSDEEKKLSTKKCK